MNKNRNFDEQEAPQKNTDNAFVRVGEDGKPEIPENNSTQNQERINKDQNDRTTDLDKR